MKWSAFPLMIPLEIGIQNVKMLWEIISEVKPSSEKIIFSTPLKKGSKYVEIVKIEWRRIVSTCFLMEKLTSCQSSLILLYWLRENRSSFKFKYYDGWCHCLIIF